MIGAVVVLVLAGLMLPIAMLIAAIVVDFVIATTILFQVWHDDWVPPLIRAGSTTWARFRTRRFHSRLKHAH